MPFNDIAWVEMTRQGGSIARYHTQPTIGVQNNAAHSFGVCNLVVWLCGGDPSVELLKAALFHDVAEQTTGDIPAPAKWLNPDLKKCLVPIEKEFEDKYGLTVNLSPNDCNVLKWADMLELLYYCRDQRNLGNRGMNVLFVRGCDFLNSLPPDDRGQTLLIHLQETYNE